MKVIFIGGLTNGKIVLDYLLSNKHINVLLVITHPAGYDGPRYLDISENRTETEILYDLNANLYTEQIKCFGPDIIIVAGWSGLLSKDLIAIPTKGTIGFHPSKLPNDRGRSVLAWQIEEGYTETALTMFYYNELPDCGDLIAQERIKIEFNDYVSDVMDKVDEATYNIMRACFPLIRKGLALRKPQNICDGNFRRLRTDRDSCINWDRNAEVIYNKIRAISKPYPGAFFCRDGQKVMVWRSEILETVKDLNKENDIVPGTIVKEFGQNRLIVRCRDKFLKIQTDTELEDL